MLDSILHPSVNFINLSECICRCFTINIKIILKPRNSLDFFVSISNLIKIIGVIRVIYYVVPFEEEEKKLSILSATRYTDLLNPFMINIMITLKP